jgi:hypothetical protein
MKDQEMNVMAEQGQLADQQPHGNGGAPILKKRLGGNNQNGSCCPTGLCHNKLLTVMISAERGNELCFPGAFADNR